MKLAVISFTEAGEALARRVAGCLDEGEAECFRSPGQGLIPWTGEQFAKKRAILFIGACGIAVRAVAPFVRDKLADSAVLVMDETGRYVIPILSGHVGGANDLARLLERRTGATAVITTATDLNGAFAVDSFAKRNGLNILNREGIAKISSKILAGETVTVSIEGGERMKPAGRVPEGVRLVPYPPKGAADVVISRRAAEEPAVLRLKPREYAIGIGCRQGKTAEEIGSFIRAVLAEHGIALSDVAKIASIDRKKGEKGILEWADENRIPFVTFPKEELMAAEGEFRSSSFVERTVGVDNVCERAAVCACKAGGEIVQEKRAQCGIALAVARRKLRIEWEENVL